MDFSIVIPTKDRSKQLINTINSIVNQTILPQEITIVDASSDNVFNENKKNCEKILRDKVKLNYIKSVPSTTHQRNIGIEKSNCEIIFFFDDDVTLKEDYCERILDVYKLKINENTGGVCGIFTTLKEPMLLKLILMRIFFMRRYEKKGKARILPSLQPVEILKPGRIIQVECMPGGACSYYRKVLEEFKFDEHLDKFALGEDRDLSYRVSRKYKLFQTPHALVEHKFKKGYTRNEKKDQIINEHYLARKHLKPRSINWLAYYWSVIGHLVFSFIKGCLTFDNNEFLGVIDGLKTIIMKRDIFSNQRRE